MHEKVSSEEKQALVSSLNGRIRTLNQWLDTFSAGKMTEEAAAYMYMLLGIDEMGLQVDSGPDLCE